MRCLRHESEADRQRYWNSATWRYYTHFFLVKKIIDKIIKYLRRVKGLSYK